MSGAGHAAATAAIAYVVLLVTIRLAGKRCVGEASPFDFVLAWIVGDLVASVTWGKVPAVQGLVAVAALALLHVALAAACQRSERLDRLVEGVSVVIAREGQLDRPAAAREHLREEELRELARVAAIERLEDAAEARLERAGRMSWRLVPDAARLRRRDVQDRRGG